jgi:hypothetical protein
MLMMVRDIVVVVIVCTWFHLLGSLDVQCGEHISHVNKACALITSFASVICISNKRALS